jgi:hypothetical protein
MKKFNASSIKKNSKFEETPPLDKTDIKIIVEEISRVNKEILKPLVNIESILIETHSEKNEDKKREEQELKCKFAAIVMDKFFFFVALIYAVTTFAGLILTITNFYKF